MSWQDEIMIAVSNAKYAGASAQQVADAFDDAMDTYYDGSPVPKGVVNSVVGNVTGSVSQMGNVKNLRM